MPYIAIPRHVSETREWFTVAYESPKVIASDALFTVADPDGFLFPVLSSAMFTAWLRTIGGRIKSDLRSQDQWFIIHSLCHPLLPISGSALLSLARN